MPVLTPQYGLVFLLSDLAPEVILRCENRTTDLARSYIWLRDALIEISSNPDYRDDFDQLELTGPVFTLTAGTAEYAYKNFLPLDPVTGLASLNQATLTVFMWIDPPTNSIRRTLRMGSFREGDRRTMVGNAQPGMVYRFGDTLGFSPTPDKNYQVQARILQYHPIEDQSLSATQIMLPREWNEVLIWEATQRGFMELLEFEKAQQVSVLLHGDPKHPERVGMYHSLKMRRSKEMWRQEQRLRIDVPGYGYGRQ